MSEIDIRDNVESSIDTIRICDYDICDNIVEILFIHSGYVAITDSSERELALFIKSKEHALNIKKAIDKAIELGWWD